MKKYFLKLAICFAIVFFSIAGTAQKTTPKAPASYPNLILKLSYQNQLQSKVKEIQKKTNPANKIPGTRISPIVLKNISNAPDFLAAYK
jgi:hypothetical protein